MVVVVANVPSPQEVAAAPEPQLLTEGAVASPGYQAPQLVKGGGSAGDPNHPAMGQLQPSLGQLQPGMQRVPIYPEPDIAEHALCCCCFGM